MESERGYSPIGDRSVSKTSKNQHKQSRTTFLRQEFTGESEGFSTGDGTAFPRFIFHTKVFVRRYCAKETVHASVMTGKFMIHGAIYRSLLDLLIEPITLNV